MVSGSQWTVYQRASADCETGSGLAVSTVSGRQNCGRVQQRATAEMSTVLLQTDDEGEVASYSRDTTNDRGNIGLIPLSDGRGGDNRKGRKADDEGFGAHGG